MTVKQGETRQILRTLTGKARYVSGPDPHPPSPVAPPPGMPQEVADQIVNDLSNGAKVLATLSTASYLIGIAQDDETSLRLAESAAYNLREALDAVVVGEDAGSSGMESVKDALERFHAATADPQIDKEAAQQGLVRDLLRLETDGELNGHRSRQFLSWLESRTGIKPLPGEDDPNRQFTKLRRTVNGTLHTSGALPLVAAAYDEVITWFTRVFTPPDERVHAIVDLARTPYTDQTQVTVLRRTIAYNAHHLVRFLAEVQDPAWLDALFDGGLIGPPRDGEPWPVNALVGGKGGIEPRRTVALLERIRSHVASGPPDAFLALDRELIQLCFRLGDDPDAHALASTIVRKRRSDHWVQRIAVFIAKEAQPGAPIQATVARSVIANDLASDARHQTRTMAKLLVEGLNEENARERLTLLAAKVAKLASSDRAKYFQPGSAALNSPVVGGALPDELVIVAQQLTSAIPSARDLGLTTDDLLEIVASIPGWTGERVVCRVLVGAADVPRERKVAHMRIRLGSSAATGDDRDLLADIGAVSAGEAADLAGALGEPSPPAESDEAGFAPLPQDWRHAWRWSVVLPPEVLVGWEPAIAAVTGQLGVPDEDTLRQRGPVTVSGRPDSPYTAQQLAELPPIEAAELVAAWRAEPDRSAWGTSIYELGSELEQTVAADLTAWTADPVGIATALRQPTYIQRYLRVIERNAKDLSDQIGPVMEVIELVRSEPWVPAQITRDEVDPDVAWSGLDQTVVEVIAAFANVKADFGEHLDSAWDITEQLVRCLPDELPPLPDTHDPEAHDDAYGRAINRTCGQALEAAVSLGWLGNYRDGRPPERFTDILDWVLTVPGSVGAELRSILAAFRPVLEGSAKDWLERRHGDLFGGDIGRLAFEATLKYPRSPTPWLYANYKARIAQAALDGVPNAVALPLIGYLWEVDGFTIPGILGSYKGDAPVLRKTAEEIASLVQDFDTGDPMVARALKFWDGMLDGAGTTVPPESLAGAGRWAFVSAVPRNELLSRFDRTTRLTGGAVELASEVADLCRDAQPSATGLKILTRMQGIGEVWEADQTGRTGLDALGAATGHGLGPEFNRLRHRLIELGFHAAADITDEAT